MSDQDLYVGTNFSFSISVTGSAPFTYQWYHMPLDESGNPTSGPIALTNGVSATLLFSPIQPEHEGIYQAFVTNSFGVASSMEVILNVRDFGFPP